jgi:VWFA-related protein
MKSGLTMTQSKRCTQGPRPRKTNSGWWYAGLLSAFLVSQACGQTAPGTQPVAPATAPAPTVSTNVNEVSLDLVVHNKKHKPVLDLKPGDVAVTDNDTAVTLNELHLVTKKANNGHLITLVFDHFSGSEAKGAQNLANKVLKMLPANGYSFALLDFSGRLRLIQGFTENRSDIEQAVKTVTDTKKAIAPVVLLATGTVVKNPNDHSDDERAKAAAIAEKNLIAITRTGVDSSGTRVDVSMRARYQTLLTALTAARQIRQDEHALPNLAGLLALVRSQQQFAGRKAILYFTRNAQMDSAAKEMVKTITGAANRAGVSLYVVDMNTLDVGGEHQIQNAILNGGPAYDITPKSVNGAPAASPSHQTLGTGIPGSAAFGTNNDFMMRSDEYSMFSAVKSPLADMAKSTGGAYIDAQNSTKKPLQQMLQDLTTYYQASYVPPFQEYDGSFRTIAVKPVRKGLNIKAKTGYLAVASNEQGGVRPFEVPLLKVLKSAELPSDFKFKATILKMGDLPDGNTSTLAVEVPIAELQSSKDTHTNLFSARVAIVAQVKDKNGTVVEHFGEDITRRGSLESIDTDQSAVISLQRHFLSIPGAYVMEVAVLDRLSGKSSAQRVNFEILPAPNGPALSEIVLVRKVDVLHDEDDPLEPLRYESNRITPNLSGQLPKDAKSVSLFFLLHPDPKASTPATLEMEVSRNGVPGRRTPLPLPQQTRVASDTIPYMANFRAKTLAPGSYQVETFLTQGGKTAERHLSFTIEGTAGTQATAPQDANLQLSSGDLHSPTQLVITALTNPIQPLTPEEQAALLADTRQRAVSYTDALPNFLCIEVTNRSYDPTGTGRWRHKDTIAELLQYRDKAETRTMLEVNGRTVSNEDRNTMKGMFSTGELGGGLKAIFQPSSKADFQWKETDALEDGTVQVFSFRVAKQSLAWSISAANGLEYFPAFHGLVFIDSATHGVRRISMVADNLPKDFPVHATSITIDYDYISINNHDYLMPISAEVSKLEFKRYATLNTIEFRNYRRFGSTVKILPSAPEQKP